MSTTWAEGQRQAEVETLIRDYGHDRQTATELVELRARLEELEERGARRREPEPPGDDKGGEPGGEEPATLTLEEFARQRGESFDPSLPEGGVSDETLDMFRRGDTGPFRARRVPANPPASPPPPPPPVDPVPELKRQIAEAQAAGDLRRVDDLQAAWRSHLLARTDADGHQPAPPPPEGAPAPPTVAEIKRQLAEATAAGDWQKVDELNAAWRAQLMS